MGELAGADLSPHDLGLVGLPAQGAQRVGREGLGLWMMAGQGAGKGGPTGGGATPYLFDPPLSHAWKGAKAITSKSPQSTGLEVRDPSELAAHSFDCVSSLWGGCRTFFSAGTLLRKDVQAPDLASTCPELQGHTRPPVGVDSPTALRWRLDVLFSVLLPKDVWSCQQIINLSLNHGDNIYI